MDGVSLNSSTSGYASHQGNARAVPYGASTSGYASHQGNARGVPYGVAPVPSRTMAGKVMYPTRGLDKREKVASFETCIARR